MFYVCKYTKKIGNLHNFLKIFSETLANFVRNA